MVIIYGDNEIHPTPLGDLMLDLLWEKMVEEPHVDFKLVLDISRKGRFPRTAKHIFAIANRGGGWILIGFKDDKKKITPIGLPEDFQLDQAQLQEKFNAYSSEKIELGYAIFERYLEEGGVIRTKRFAAIYIPPSMSLLVPTKDGAYVDGDKKKKAFKKDDVLTRRGTQSVIATPREHADIKVRIEADRQRISLLSGHPDEVNETLFSNLLQVQKIPDFIHEVEIHTDEIPFSRTGIQPFAKRGRRLYSFCKFTSRRFSQYAIPNSYRKHKTKELIQSLDGRNLVTHIMNLEATAAMRTRRMILDNDSRPRSLYYPCDGSVRYESWEGYEGRRPRKVVRRFYMSQIEDFRWRHYSIALGFQWIGNQCYLQLEPGIILTKDGRTPVHHPIDGTAITRLLRLRYNSHYRLDLRFWISKMPKNDSGLISFGNRIEIRSNLIRTYMEYGIDGDTPSKEQQTGPYRFGDFSDGLAMQSGFIKEPKLVFGNQHEEEDPRIGLKYFGPYHAPDETPLNRVRIGIIGTGSGRKLGKRILDLLGTEIKSPSNNRFLFPDFPGFKANSPIKCEFEYSDSWSATLGQAEIDRIVSITEAHARIYAAVEMFQNKVKAIAMEDNHPDVILCILPDVINDYCGISKRTRGAKRPRYTKKEKEFAKARAEGQTTLVDFKLAEPSFKSFDLHDAIKGRVMEYRIPIQLLIAKKAEAILDYPHKGKAVQDPATFCWNFSTAQYYKANGKPWRLARLESDTCYVGIAFYSRRDDPLRSLRVSMAQVFTHSGEGFVLQGSKVEIDEDTREAHLPSNDAHDLLKRAIEAYSFRTGHQPSRVVVHKKSKFNSDERSGFLDAIGSASADFVCIRQSHGLRFVRTGRYPVLRGTLINLDSRSSLLYTSGYIPRLRTYPGPRIPRPLYLELDCDSETEFVAEEILKLTKINWNTSKFADKLPITIVFPDKVGDILSESPEEKAVLSHYRFYM